MPVDACQVLQTIAAVGSVAAAANMHAKPAHDEATNSGAVEARGKELKSQVLKAVDDMKETPTAGAEQKALLKEAVEKGQKTIDAQDKRAKANTDSENKIVSNAKYVADVAKGTVSHHSIREEEAELSEEIRTAAAEAHRSERANTKA